MAASAVTRTRLRPVDYSDILSISSQIPVLKGYFANPNTISVSGVFTVLNVGTGEGVVNNGFVVSSTGLLTPPAAGVYRVQVIHTLNSVFSVRIFQADGTHRTVSFDVTAAAAVGTTSCSMSHVDILITGDQKIGIMCMDRPSSTVIHRTIITQIH